MTTRTAIAFALGAGLATLAGVPGSRNAGAEQPPKPCYVALLHGSGPDLHDQGSLSAPVERYWNPSSDPARSLSAPAGAPTSMASRCVVWRVGYDGNVPWWHVRAAGRVARSLHDFIDAHQIPDGGLVLIGHSMGGLVARYIVNNGAGESPYHNEYAAADARMDYALVRRKTALIVTVDTPHTGTEAADALHGAADHAFSNGAMGLLKALGVIRDSPANGSLTRGYLEAAGAPGGEMADEGRSVPIYTVAGISPVPPVTAVTTRADRRLDLAWSLLCNQRSPINLWGAACGPDRAKVGSISGDGLVARASAHGFWTRTSPNGRPTISGALAPWLDRRENHSEGRYTAQALLLIDLLDRIEPIEPIDRRVMGR